MFNKILLSVAVVSVLLTVALVFAASGIGSDFLFETFDMVYSTWILNQVANVTAGAALVSIVLFRIRN